MCDIKRRGEKRAFNPKNEGIEGMIGGGKG